MSSSYYPPSPLPPSAATDEKEVVEMRGLLESKENELRDARKKIRELELEVESVKMNARKVAEAFAGLGP